MGTNVFVDPSELSIPPFMDRMILKSLDPSKVEHVHKEFAEIEGKSRIANQYLSDEMRYHSFDPKKLCRIKESAMESGDLERCTAFEEHEAAVRGGRPAQVRAAPLLKGYFGNGKVLTNSISQAGDLVNRPVSYMTGLVQDAIKMVTDRYMRSTIDYIEVTWARPSLACTLLITTWSRLSFHTTDFGWVEPVLSGPVALPEKEVILFLSYGKERKSINVLLGLPAPAMKISKN